MVGEHAPVAVFAYRRPEHLSRTLDSLARCAEAGATHVTLFCDGAKGDADAPDVALVREVAASAEGFASVSVVPRARNVGLSANVIDGVTSMLREHPRVIVLEDDMVVSSAFLRYLNDGLDLYADEAGVASIHAYVYPTDEPLPDSFFLRGADCWGWATWRRGWAMFDPDGAGLLARLESAGATRDFDFDGAFPYTQMLRDQVAGRTDSWAIRWYASAFLAGALTLYPGRSLVENIGLDGSGTNSLGGRGLAAPAGTVPALRRVPVVEDAAARAVVARALRGQGAGRRRGWLSILRGRGR